MRIHALRLEAADPDELGDFYDDLGLSVVPSKSGVVVSFGRTDVTFERTTRGEGEDPFYHFAITVPANRFDAAYEWLDDHVGLLPDVETGKTRFEFGAYLDATACYFRDPAGNIGELIARHALENGVSEDDPFGPEDLLAVSEIGLVVDDVPAVARDIVETTGEPELGGGDDFRMIGDQHGAFIVVDVRRPWFVGGDDPGVFLTDVLADVDAPLSVDDYPYEIRVA